MGNRDWFIHVEWIVLVTFLGAFYLLVSKIERNNAAQSARTDRLYEMFIDLLNEGK